MVARETLVSSFILIITFSITVGTLDHSSLRDLDLYKIAWKGPQTTEINTNEENVISISTKNKERYKCIVPDSVDQLSFDTSAKNSSSEDEINKSPIEVLEPLLKSDHCSYKFELFWVYELCHGKYLRQYHEESAKFKAKITQEYYLGRMDPKQIKAHKIEYETNKLEMDSTGQSRPTILVNGHYKPYVMFNMTEGTKCDLTKHSRVSKIIYVCNEEPKLELYSIKEISTCEYEAIVLSPMLCQHKDFKIDINTQHEIKCYSVGGSPRRPKKIVETDEAEEADEYKNDKRRGFAYFHGKTLIIDADLLLS